MRILASLGVKDEVELLPLVLAHLHRIGVDLVIALDWGSTDGSLELLEAAQRRGEVILVPLTELERDEVMGARPDPFTDGAWARRPLAIAREHGADWLLCLDADELWLPAGGSLRSIAERAGCDLISVDRRNVPYGPEGAYMPVPPHVDAYDQVYLFGDRRPGRRELEADPALAWIASRVMPKIMVRPALVISTTPGEHDAVAASGISLRRETAADIVIAHLPITTWPRFERRVVNIRHTIERYPGFFAENGWHWVRFAELDAAGRLRDEFERGYLSPAALQRLVDDGSVTTARAVLTSAAVAERQ